jgi:nickel/cobalt exporter
MPDLAQIIQTSPSYAWLYLPVAVLLGALHALEPGHAKSLMAAYIVSIRGTSAQAALLGLSAAVGHTIVVWALAIIGLSFGDALILEHAEPWLTLLSGVLILLLATRMLVNIFRGERHSHDHHSHGHDHHAHGHHQPHGYQNTHGRAGEKNGPTATDIIWFGFTGGLLPCPAAIAVLLICLQIKQFTLGLAMVAAFSVGLAATLVSIGIAASWGVRKAGNVAWLDRVAGRLPLISTSIVMVIGLGMAAVGLNGIIGTRKPN